MVSMPALWTYRSNKSHVDQPLVAVVVLLMEVATRTAAPSVASHS